MNRERQAKVLAVVAIVVGAVYLLNPTAGVFELLPDVIPVVGNLDEAAATALLLWGVQALRGQAALATPPDSDQP
jgi:uncharacterized membrane protein YkvA (DUF1232 family)